MLAGKRALVTGATSGIGKATARIFAREGATVVATGRNQAALDELVKEDESGGKILAVQGDLTQPGVCKRVVDEAVAKLGGELSTVVNCAGVLKGGALGTEACDDVENLMVNLRANTIAPFEVLQHSSKYLKEYAGAGAGGEKKRKRAAEAAVVNVSSVNGLQAFQGTASYCMSKAAADMLTRCAAVDLAESGVRVNSVNPGVTITELQKRGGLSDEAYEGFLKRSIEHTHPLAKSLDRCAEPEEVGELIAFLCSDKAKFITGDCVAIDGGRKCLGAR